MKWSWMGLWKRRISIGIRAQKNIILFTKPDLKTAFRLYWILLSEECKNQWAKWTYFYDLSQHSKNKFRFFIIKKIKESETDFCTPENQLFFHLNM